jgi:TRAP-type C4-dicarboxylate transport system substrate-binding protein
MRYQLRHSCPRFTIPFLVFLLSSTAALAQTRWDMPTAYASSYFHTENIIQFAADVEKATEGKLKITVHSNASLFKGSEIKRAVQGGQAQIGEVLLSGYENEDPIYGVDTVPFLATTYADAMKLWKASRKPTEDRFAKQGLKILYVVA